MKITPLEIRKKSFEKAFRGLDKEEVYAFLATLSSEWEKMLDENKELRFKLESAEKEIEKLREVENSLFKTLKTAEDTGANMIDQATKTAELHMKETEMNAEAMLNEAKGKAKDMIEMAEAKAKNATDEMEDRLRSMAQIYRTLENVREDLLSDIKTFATEAIEKTNRVKTQFKTVDIDEELMRVKRDITSAESINESSRAGRGHSFSNAAKNKPQAANAKPAHMEQDKDNSFFDDLD